MSFIVNGTTLDGIVANNTTIEAAYMNNVLVFEDNVSIDIPAGSTKTIEELCNEFAPGKNKVTLTLDGIRGPLESGNLAGLNVTLVNNGEIQGLRSNAAGGDALILTSNLTLINNGWIKGAGGRGGYGGKGKDDTYQTSSTTSETRGNNYPNDFWAVGINVDDWIGWDGYHKKQYGVMPSPTTIPGISGTFYKGNFIVNKGDGYHHYQIIRELTTTTNHTRIGGAGGAGGYGIGYNQSKTSGSAGNGSSPIGGNSGGYGGAGGDWGQDGNKGNQGYGGGDLGYPGYAAGKAITGSSYLNTGSTTGNVKGEIV